MAQKGKKRGRWLDILVLVLVVVLIGGAVYKFKKADTTANTGTLTAVTYTVEIQKVRQFAESNIRSGDKLYDKTSGNCIGTVTAVALSPAYEPMVGADGEAVLAPVENRYDVLLTVEAEAQESGGSYYVNRTYELVCNSLKHFATKYFEAEGRIQDIWQS